MKMRITVIDYGCSNTLSVRRAFESLGCEVELTSGIYDILGASALVLPGVGAFGDGMERLNSLGLAGAILEKARQGTPLLGICLGMQFLFERSTEFGAHRGLGLIPGEVVRIPGFSPRGERQRVPHIGWNALIPPEGQGGFSSILQSVNPGEEVYFVHSFEAVTDTQFRLADTMYGGRRVCAAVHYGNVFGTQFHPEKSGETGLGILREYISFCASL